MITAQIEFPEVRESNQSQSIAEQIISDKHQAYIKGSQRFQRLYYVTRLLGGLAAAILPFVVSSLPQLATGLSLIVVVSVVIDAIFDPKSKWATYSRASDMLAIARLKAHGQFEQSKEILEQIFRVELNLVSDLVDLDEVLDKAKTAGSDK